MERNGIWHLRVVWVSSQLNTAHWAAHWRFPVPINWDVNSGLYLHRVIFDY